MRKVMRILPVIITLVFLGRSFYSWYTISFPPAPVEILEDSLEELSNKSLKQRKKALDLISQNVTVDVLALKPDVQASIVKCLEERYKETIESGKAFGDHDFGIFLSGFTILAKTIPHTAETKAFLQEIMNNTRGELVDDSFNICKEFAMKAYGKDTLYRGGRSIAEAQQKMEEAEQLIK